MIAHTKWPWFSGHNDAPEPEYLVSYPETGGTIALVPRQGDSQLIAFAPTAPHFCHYPKCPGNVNRLKLELWDKLKESLEKVLMVSLLPHDVSGCQMVQDVRDILTLAREL